MTTEVEIVGQDAVPPPEETAGRHDRLLRSASWANLRAGNLGVLPLVVGLVFIVVFFSFKATNFFTAPNFINIVVQMAGTTMLAYGVVFVLLLGEIDLSISYVAGIGALTVAVLQNPGSPAKFLGVQLSSHELNGLVAMVIAVVACAVIGLLQGTVVAKVGVPSFVVTLAGFLIWQGVILHRLEVPGSIIIQDRWINYTANYTFSPFAGWLIAAIVTGALRARGARRRHRQATGGRSRSRIACSSSSRSSGVAIASFGTVAICNHVVIQGTRLGLPLPGVIIVVFLVALTYPRQADDVRPPRLRRRRQRRGGAARRASTSAGSASSCS